MAQSETTSKGYQVHTAKFNSSSKGIQHLQSFRFRHLYSFRLRNLQSFRLRRLQSFGLISSAVDDSVGSAADDSVGSAVGDSVGARLATVSAQQLATQTAQRLKTRLLQCKTRGAYMLKGGGAYMQKGMLGHTADRRARRPLCLRCTRFPLHPQTLHSVVINICAALACPLPVSPCNDLHREYISATSLLLTTEGR